MTVGLFLCDHVDDAYQGVFGDYSDMFIQLFPELDFILYDVINGVFPLDLKECDIYMATGSRHSAYEPLEWIDRLKAVIRTIAQRDKYFIGFCFGHQLLGEALGGKVQKSEKEWCVGVHEFTIQSKADWMLPDRDKVQLLMMCQDQVWQLPEKGRVLAGNDSCPIGMMQIGDKLLGIQAHPEFPKAYDEHLMRLRRDRMGEEVVNEGIKSLQKEVHQAIIKEWILKFINYR